MEPNTSGEPLSRDLLTRNLGHLGFRRFLPHPSLRPWVQCYWSAQMSLEHSFTEKLYPDGGTSLTFDFADRARPASSFSARQELNKLSFGPRLDSFGLRFHPGGASYLLGLPIGELSGASYDAVDLDLEGLDSLHNRMREAEPEERAALAEVWLLRRAKHADPNTSLVTRLWPRLEIPDLGLDQLVRSSGYSRRKLERAFQNEVGISPHQLRLLLRVNRARSLIKQRPQRTLTEVALACGYYDQAHFIRHFERVAEVTPGAYRRLQLARLLERL